MRGASAEARALLHDLKPYKDGNPILWRLHRLDILDKHQGIVPVGAAHRSLDIMPFMRASLHRALAESPTAAGLSGTVAANLGPLHLLPRDRQFPLRDGAELFRAPLNSPMPPGNEMDFTFEIAFGEGQIIDGEAVIPALNELADYVAGVFSPFEAKVLY